MKAAGYLVAREGPLDALVATHPSGRPVSGVEMHEFTKEHFALTADKRAAHAAAHPAKINPPKPVSPPLPSKLKPVPLPLGEPRTSMIDNHAVLTKTRLLSSNNDRLAAIMQGLTDNKSTGGWISRGETAHFPTFHLDPPVAYELESSLRAAGYQVFSTKTDHYLRDTLVVKHPSGRAVSGAEVHKFTKEHFALTADMRDAHAKQYPASGNPTQAGSPRSSLVTPPALQPGGLKPPATKTDASTALLAPKPPALNPYTSATLPAPKPSVPPKPVPAAPPKAALLSPMTVAPPLPPSEPFKPSKFWKKAAKIAVAGGSAAGHTIAGAGKLAVIGTVGTIGMLALPSLLETSSRPHRHYTNTLDNSDLEPPSMAFASTDSIGAGVVSVPQVEQQPQQGSWVAKMAARDAASIAPGQQPKR